MTTAYPAAPAFAPIYSRSPMKIRVPVTIPIPVKVVPQYIPVKEPVPVPQYIHVKETVPVPQYIPQVQVVKECVTVPVPQPYEVEVVKEIEVAPIVQQNITLYQPRPEPSITVCQYPREWYYVEERKTIAEGQMLAKTIKTLTLRVAHGDDDCEQKISSGKTSLHDDDLDLREGRLVGIRFQNVQVKPRQQVTSAILQFHAKLDKSDNCQVDIYGDASGDASAFNHELNSVSQRQHTKAQVHWSIPHWVPGSQYTSPELGPIVQEIINNPRWHPGASLALVLHGTSGHRSAWAFDGNPSMSPALIIKVVEEAEHQIGGASSSSAASSPQLAPSAALGVPLRAPSHGVAPFAGPPLHGPVHTLGGSPDVHDGYDALGHQRAVGPHGDPWNLPRYAHQDQLHAGPPHHNQAAHLIYEDKFRYPRYNLSHECLRPTRLERQIPESARPLLASATVLGQPGSPVGLGAAGALRALDAADGVLDGRVFGVPLPGVGPISPPMTRLK